MKESLDKAKEELKRADHLIYVSLKYTRTCDVFKSIIERLINSIDFMLDTLLRKLEEDKKIKEIPSQPITKCNLVKSVYNDEKLNELADFYLRLRQINRAQFDRSKEFRRHVTMSVKLGEECVNVDIDSITDNYKKVKGYYEHIEKIIKGEL